MVKRIPLVQESCQVDHGFIEMWNEGHCQPHIIASERGEGTGYHNGFDYMILLGY